MSGAYGWGGRGRKWAGLVEGWGSGGPHSHWTGLMWAWSAKGGRGFPAPPTEAAIRRQPTGGVASTNRRPPILRGGRGVGKGGRGGGVTSQWRVCDVTMGRIMTS